MSKHSSLSVNRKPSIPLRLGLLTIIIASSALAFVSLTTINHTVKAASGPQEKSLPGSYPWGIAFDKKGNAWVAEPGCDPQPFVCARTQTGSIAQVKRSPFSVTTNFTEPSGKGFASPIFVVTDATGNIWFTEPNVNAIGELIPNLKNPAASTWKQWVVPTASAAPFQLAFDAHGILWFTETLASQIGSFNPVTHRFTETATPTATSIPYGITGPDAHGAMWFTENNATVARIGSFLPPTTGKLKKANINEYLTKNPGLHTTVHLITLDQKGNAWWSEGFSGRIGSLAINKASKGTSQGVHEYQTPLCNNCGTHISGITVDSAGVIWFDDSLKNWVDSYNPATHKFSIPYQLANGSHPHDGLQVANDNTVFFAEEFAQKLGRITQANVGKSRK